MLDELEFVKANNMARDQQSAFQESKETLARWISAFPIINRQYSGRDPMGRSFGWKQAGAGSGMALGGWIGGVLFEVFGSYNITIVLSVLASVGGAALIFSMPPTRGLLIPNWEDSVPSIDSSDAPATSSLPDAPNAPAGAASPASGGD